MYNILKILLHYLLIIRIMQNRFIKPILIYLCTFPYQHIHRKTGSLIQYNVCNVAPWFFMCCPHSFLYYSGPYGYPQITPPKIYLHIICVGTLPTEFCTLFILFLYIFSAISLTLSVNHIYAVVPSV